MKENGGKRIEIKMKEEQKNAEVRKKATNTEKKEENTFEISFGQVGNSCLCSKNTKRKPKMD